MKTQNLLRKHNYFSWCLLGLLLCLTHPLFSQNQKTNLPTIYIDTDGGAPVVSKENYLKARIRIVSSDLTENLDTLTEVRGRGNSTWGMAKKPYRIKLDKKYNILNLPAKAKSWTLLANYADKTLIRNAVAFKISEIVGLEFSPSARFVDLVLNGEFLGNYMLSDQVQVDKKRVNVDELEKTDVDDDIITGGYLLEIDGFAASEPEWFTTNLKNLKITIKSPDEDEITDKQRNYIKNFVNDFESRLFSADFKDAELGYRALVDTITLINWYIGCELTGNSDSFWSTYIYKKRGIDKLFFGPMWDYDIAFNNDSRLGDATEKLMRKYAHNPRAWIERLYQDEWFQQAVWSRWSELLDGGIHSQLTGYIDELTTQLDESQKLNFNLWGGVNKKVYLEYRLFNTYKEGVDYLKTYLANRIAFLTNSFKYVEPPKPSEAFTADNAYYMIMNKKSNNVIELTDESTAANSPLVLWEPKSNDDSQLWEFVPLEENHFRIVNKLSELAIAGNGKGNNLIQKASANDNTQKWKVVPVNTGNVYSLVNVASDFSMNNSGGSLANGTAVIEYDNGIVNNGEYNTVQSENRQWYLQKMEMKDVSSTNNPAYNQSLRIYPNPAVDYLNIQVYLNEHTSTKLILYNLLGEKQMEKVYSGCNVGEQLFTIPVSQFESGVYLLTLTSDQGERASQKIVIVNSSED